MPESKFVGRRAELDRLQQFLAKAAAEIYDAKGAVAMTERARRMLSTAAP